MKFSLSYVLVFLLATVSLSRFFGAHQYMSEGQDLKALVVVLLSLACFLFSLAFMAYRIYAEEKRANNLKIRVPLFDWISEKFTTTLEAKNVSKN